MHTAYRTMKKKNADSWHKTEKH